MMSVAAISSLTGSLAWICSYPFDAIKNTIQSGKTWDEVKLQVSREGVVTKLFKGCTTSTGRAMLVTSSRMISYEWITQLMNKQ
jgi:hypothetical protein